MSEENNVRINRDKETSLEFQVKIDGADDLMSSTTVRFVIQNDKYNLSFPCEHGTDDNWKVNIPVLPDDLLENGTYDMCVEVIVDNYFFKPASGQVSILSEPKVSFTPKKQEKQEKKEEKEINETAPGTGSVDGGQPSPNNALLVPEKPPKNVHKPKHKKSPEEDLETVKKIADEVIPGEGSDYAQEGSFNPQKVAERIVLDALGLKPEARAKLVKQGAGSLFKRNAEGRLVVEGLEDPTFKVKMSEAAKEVKEEKVKALLRELAN